MPLVSYAVQTPAPWANGGGTTVELVSLAASVRLTPGLPQWRLSIATLQSPAPFSPLPGMLRQFMPVGGSVVLIIDGERVPVTEGTVCRFDGGAAVELLELSGECNAVNLMVATADQHAGAPLPAEMLRLTHHTPDSAGSAGSDARTAKDVLFVIPLTHADGAEKFDVICPINLDSDTPDYSAVRTGSWAAIAKSGCHSSASPLTAN